MSNENINPEFRLGTFSAAVSPSFPGLVIQGKILALEALLPVCNEAGIVMTGVSTMIEVLDNWDTNFLALERVINEHREELDHLIEQHGVAVEQLKHHPPVSPRQVICCGANYRKHVIEYIVKSGEGCPPALPEDENSRRKWAEELMDKRAREGSPYTFFKPITAVTGPFENIRIPDYVSEPDWELELAVIMSKPAYCIERARAMDFVAGFTIANDISARDHIWRRDDMAALGTDWMASKCAPGFLPLGPYLVPTSFIDDIGELRLTLKVNDRIMQDEYASDMIFDISRQIEYTSKLIQLLPGDVICTGSPAGNAMSHGNRYLKNGDIMEGHITGLGTQRNPIIVN